MIEISEMIKPKITAACSFWKPERRRDEVIRRVAYKLRRAFDHLPGGAFGFTYLEPQGGAILDATRSFRTMLTGPVHSHYAQFTPVGGHSLASTSSK